MRISFTGNCEVSLVKDKIANLLPTDAHIEIIPPSKKKVVVLVTKEHHCLGEERHHAAEEVDLAHRPGDVSAVADPATGVSVYDSTADSAGMRWNLMTVATDPSPRCRNVNGCSFSSTPRRSLCSASSRKAASTWQSSKHC